MDLFRGTHSLHSQQYMFTVSNPSHELVTPDQYAQLVSTISQYQLIPGFINQYIDDPWDVVLKLLPYSKNTIIDVVLPYIPYSRHEEGLKVNEYKTLGRYILYKEQVIGIRVLIKSNKALMSEQNVKNSINKSLVQQRFKCRKQQIPGKLQNFYIQNEIKGYENSITVGDFYLTTSKFKLALLFQSEIKQASVIEPYIMMGCEVLSMVNDEQIQYEAFINYYLKKDYHDCFIEGNKTVITSLRQICWKSDVIFLYGGCKTSPSLGKVYFTRSFIEYGNDLNSNPSQRAFQTEDVQFFPLVDLTKDKNFLAEPEYNSNRLNVCRKYNIGRNRTQRSRLLNSTKSTMNEEIELQSLTMDSKKFDIRPLSKENYQKLQKLQQINFFYEREKLFNLAQLTGKSIIKCMYVFNMMNLFIFSKPQQIQSPFLISVPFTQKTKNLFDIIIYIFDNIKNYESNAPDLQQDLKLSNILQLYRYKDQRNTHHDYTIEEQMLKDITGRKENTIPLIEELINYHDKRKHFYLCSDDPQQKKKLKTICKDASIQLIFVDLLTIDEFSLPLEIKPITDQDIQSVLELQKYHNVLETYTLKLRQMPSQQEVNSIKQKESRKNEYPPIYTKICQQLQKKHFLSIQQALRWIIVEKEFNYDKNNPKMFNDLIINELGKKVKSNIKTLSQISTFFIANSEDQIIRKVAQISQEIMRHKNHAFASNNSMKSFPSNPKIINLEEDYEEEKENNNLVNTRVVNGFEQTKKGEQKQKGPQQIYLIRLQKCRRLKAERSKTVLMKCHRCRIEMQKKLLQKCKKCSEMICLVCIEEISGLSGLKACNELSKFCPVCNRLCDCQKCKKKIEKLIGGSSTIMSEEHYRLQEIRKILMQDEDKKQGEPNKKSDKISNITQNLFKNFSSQQQNEKIQLKRCQRCQILNVGQKRHISIECMQCGIHECYFCIQQMYEETKYKQTTIKSFYKNWKCELCDKQWQKFIENKLLKNQMLLKNQTNNKMVHQSFQHDHMDVQVDSNHTSHYAQQNLMDVAGINQLKTKSDPRLNIYNLKRKNSMDIENQSQMQRKDSFSNISFVQSRNQPDLDKRIDKKTPYFKQVQTVAAKKSTYPKLDTPKVIIPDKYPLPPQKITVQSKQSKQVPKINQKKDDEPKKRRKTSSDQGYESEDRNKKDKGASSVDVQFRQKQQQKGKSVPLWPNKSKKNKRSSSGSRSKSSKRGKNSDNGSLASFKAKKKGEKQREQKSSERKKGLTIPKPVNKNEKQKRYPKHKNDKRVQSFESRMVESSSSSSNSSYSSSSSGSSSSSSRSRQNRKRQRSRKDNKQARKRSSSKSSRSKSKQKSMKFSRSNSGSVRRQSSARQRNSSARQDTHKRSDSNKNDRDNATGDYISRGGFRGRGSWNTNYHSSGREENNNNREERGYNNSNWRGSSGNYQRGNNSNWRGGSNNQNGQSTDRYNGSSYRGGFNPNYRGRGGYNNYNNDRPYNNDKPYSRDYNSRREDTHVNVSNSNNDNSQSFQRSSFYNQPDQNSHNNNDTRKDKKQQQQKNSSGQLFVKKNVSNQDQNIDY